MKYFDEIFGIIVVSVAVFFLVKKAIALAKGDGKCSSGCSGCKSTTCKPKQGN